LEKEMSAWDLGNKISQIGYKIDGIAGITELLSEKLMDNAESGAAWTVTELLREYGEKLELLAGEVMRLELPKEDKPKEKKK
jgi:hypothetical protein